MRRRREAISVSADAPIPSMRRGAAPTVPEEVVLHDVEQRSDEWFALRLGMPTASNFAKVMASGSDGEASKLRTRLLYDLAGEKVSGEPATSFVNDAMERGHEMEPDAREFYSFTRRVELTPIGFVTRKLARGLVIGCSPDSLVGADGALEIKTIIPALLIEQSETPSKGTSRHRAQCQGTLLVTGRSWVDLMFFYRGMPVAPTYRIERDEAYISDLRNALEVFDYDLRKLIERFKNRGSR